jgi:hypothetical protein
MNKRVIRRVTDDLWDEQQPNSHCTNLALIIEAVALLLSAAGVRRRAVEVNAPRHCSVLASYIFNLERLLTVM